MKLNRTIIAALAGLLAVAAAAAWSAPGWRGAMTGPSNTSEPSVDPVRAPAVQRTNPVAAPTVRPVTHDERNEDEVGEELEAQAPPEPKPAEVMLSAIHARWSSESKGADWGPVFEGELRSVFDTLDLPSADLVEVDCRTTLCRVEIECDSHATLMQVLRATESRERLKSSMMAPWVQDGHLVSYVSPLLATRDAPMDPTDL
jgi:hypothetical protein